MTFLDLIATPAWHADAACRGMKTAAFFPKRGEDHVFHAAKAVCKTCPVKAECLSDAMANHESYGVWGGTSEKQRRIMRREQEVPIHKAWAKLDADKVRHMRKLASEGFSTRELGRRFGVTDNTAWKAITGQTWEDVS